MLSDLSQPLREEERQAWQRLIRVIGHEMNNSLAPIKSIAGSLATIVERDPPPSDWRDDVQRGLARHRLAVRVAEPLHERLRAPREAAAAQARAARRRRGSSIASSRSRRRITSRSSAGPRLTIQGDGDQLEQLLINLIRNAVDAVRETGGGVRVGWQRLPGSSPPTMELWVEDEGPGPVEHGQPVRAVLHDQAGRIGYRPRPEPADRRSARRQPDAREPRRPRGLPRQPAHSRSRRVTPVKPEACGADRMS